MDTHNTEAALQESEARFRAIAEYSPQAICIIDEQGRIGWANDKAVELSGFTREQLMAAPSFRGFVAPESQDFVMGNFMKFAAGEAYQHHYYFYCLRAGGQKRLLEKYMTDFVDRHGKRNLILNMMDVTERKKAEDALRESEERYRAIVDNIGIGVALISPEMEVLSINAQMRKWNPHVDLGQKNICYRVFNSPPGEDVCSYCPTALTLKDGQVHESVTETPMNGQIFNYRVVASPIRDRQGNVIAAIEMVEDITERKRMEEDARRRTRELEIFYGACMGREDRIMELKKKIAELEKRLACDPQK